MRGDSQNRHVIEGVEVILGDATFTHRLMEWDQGPFVAEIANQSTEIGVRIANTSNILNDALVIETEAGRVLDQGNFGQSRDDVVVRLSDQAQRETLLTSDLLRKDDLVTLFPFPD